MVDLERLREAYSTAADGRDGEHLSETDWERLALGDMAPEEQHRTFDHILDCTRCAEIYRAVTLVSSEAPAFDEQAPARIAIVPTGAAERRVPWMPLGLLALAAAVLIGLVTPLMVGRGPTPGPDVVVRSADDARPGIVPVDPVAELAWRPGSDVVFSWRVVAVDEAVVVEVLDAGGEPIWSSPETTERVTAWPAARVPGPGRYYWRVVPSGSSDVAGSELVAFDLVTASPP